MQPTAAPLPESPASAEGFLRSARVLGPEGGALHSLEVLLAWLAEQSASMRMQVRRIGFDAMDAWRREPAPRVRLVHETGRFFTVEGGRFSSPEGSWDQPILDQPEVGLLGLLTATFGEVPHFLVQAKWEPGNRTPQLSPSVQATHSNYTRVHGGRAQPYIERFLQASRGSLVLDALLPEHGSYFRRKRNRNAVVRVEPEIEVLPGYVWLTLGQLKALLAIDDVVHMDTRAILGALPLCSPRDGAEYLALSHPHPCVASLVRSATAPVDSEVLAAWLRDPGPEGRIDLQLCSLDELRGWRLDDDAMRPDQDTPDAFSIVAVEVNAERREVARWTQPMIAPGRPGFLGLLVRDHGGTSSFLAEARPEPGHEGRLHVFPTVTTNDPGRAPLASHFLDAPASRVRFSATNSEEGGRFYRYDQVMKIVESDVEVGDEAGSRRRWLTLGELHYLAEQGVLTIEMRNLLACLPTWEPTTAGA